MHGRKHWKCVSRARKLFIGITAIYINRISLPVTTAIRQTTRFYDLFFRNGTVKIITVGDCRGPIEKINILKFFKEII